MVVLVACGLSPFLIGYFAGYDTSLSYLNTVNGPKLLGILDSESWIFNNTSLGTVFQVVSGQTARIWSMEISGRYFASLQVVNNDSVMPYQDVDMSTILDEAMKINASYVIMDPMVVNLAFTKLESFYTGIGPSDVGKTFPVFSENSRLADVVNVSTSPTVEVSFISSSSASKVVILQIERHPLKTLWDASFTDSDGWSVALNGTISFIDGGLVLTAPPYTSEKVYAEYNFKQAITISNNTYVLLRVGAQDLGTLSGFYILFDSGKSIIKTFGAPSVFCISLSQFAGQHPNVILLYNFLTPSTVGTNASYSVTYGWVALIDE